MPGFRFASSRDRRPSIASISAVACVLLLVIPLATAWAVPPLTDFTRRVGNYYWEDPFESNTSPRRPDEAMRTIAALGGHAARLLFTPPGYPCDTLGQPRLDQWRLQAGLQAALDNPDIATYELTIVGCNSTGTPYFAANGPAVSEVYKNFTLDLYRTYDGTGKRFILSNWEGDNAVHCCSTYLYARNSRISPDGSGNRYDACGGIMPVDGSDPQGRSQPYRAYCDGLFSASYGYPNADAALDGFALWLQARQQGVNDGRALAAAEGRSGVEVLHAPEINVVNQLENPTFEDGRPLTDWSGALVRFHSLVQDKLPVMSPRPDLVSYSSYETMGQPAGAIRNQVCLDFGTIRAKVGLSSPSQLIVGEYAFSRFDAGGESQSRALTVEALKAAVDAGAGNVFNWELYSDIWGVYSKTNPPAELGLASDFRSLYASGYSGTACDTPVIGGGSGLRGEYYDNVDFTGTQVVRTDPTVDFDWSYGSPSPSLQPDTFSARWTGKLLAPYSDNYVFSTLTDDGVRLWINGQLVIDNWTDHAPTWNSSAAVWLNAGAQADVRLEYYENGGGATMELFWAASRFARQLIPRSQLTPAAGGGAVCGNGIVEAGEACDGGACCAACQLATAGTLCRAAASSCDAAESCPGNSAQCPADGFLPNGTACPGGSCQGGVCSADPNAGMQGEWKLDEGSGTNAFDATNHGATGSLVNGPVWTTGRSGMGLTFDGQNDAVLVPINVPESEYSFTVWVRTSAASGTLLAVVDPVAVSAGSHDRQLFLSGGRICHRVWSEETYCSPGAYNDGRWHFAAATVGSGGGRLYVDGVLVATGAKTASDFTWQTGLAIGNHAAYGPFAGSLDDVRVYSRVLAGSEVSALYGAAACSLWCPACQIPNNACTACVTLPNGLACPGGTCQNGACAGGVCGNGVVESGEACDGGPCCTSSCQLQSAGVLCRAANPGNACDAAEVCNGASASCPADGFLPNGSGCPGGSCQNGTCQAAPPHVNAIVDGATGSSTIYTTSVLTVWGSGFSGSGNTVWVQQGSSTWTVRAGSAWWYESAGQINASLPFGLTAGYANVWVTNAAGVASNNYWIYLYSRCGNGVVDAGEACDGGACCSSTCQLLAAGTLCRAANGSCDAAETCTGGSPVCPGDAWLPNGSWCPSGTCQNGSCTASSPAPQISAIVDGVTNSYTIYRTSVLTLWGSNFSTWGNTVWIQQGSTWAVGYGTPWWYESPGQINASLPTAIGTGWASVYVTNASGRASNTYWIYVN